MMLAQKTFPEVGDESHFYHGDYQVSSSKVLYGRLKGKEWIRINVETSIL